MNCSLCGQDTIEHSPMCKRCWVIWNTITPGMQDTLRKAEDKAVQGFALKMHKALKELGGPYRNF